MQPSVTGWATEDCLKRRQMVSGKALAAGIPRAKKPAASALPLTRCANQQDIPYQIAVPLSEFKGSPQEGDLTGRF